MSGLPIIGNLLQLREKKPHHTFTQWAEKYGTIYSICTGAKPIVVLNSSQLAKEISKSMAVFSLLVNIGFTQVPMLWIFKKFLWYACLYLLDLKQL